jgi:hypothetical protein
LLSAINDTNLLGLVGKVRNHELTFMLDSGASCNFISLSLLSSLGLTLNKMPSYSVRLANGK